MWRGPPEGPNNMKEEFDGIFRFTNNSDEEFKVLWNNVEYTFAPKSRSPIIIPNETAENIQAIRKKWAYKWAMREYMKSEEYNRLNNLPNTRGGIDEKSLEPYIQMCLDPLPIVKADVETKPRKVVQGKATKAVSDSESLNEAFKEETREGAVQTLGKQSTKFQVEE